MVDDPSHVKKLTVPQLGNLADEIRHELITKLADKVESGFLVGGLTSSRHQNLQIADRVLDGGLSGQRSPGWPAFLLALACALIWLISWLVAGEVLPHNRSWVAYAVGTPVFLITLFYFFENFSRLLPANF